MPPVQSLLLTAAHVNLRNKQHINSSSPPLFLFFAVPSIQRQEAGLLLVRGQIRAASAWLRWQGARRDTVLQPGEQMRRRRDDKWTRRRLGGREKDRKRERKRAYFALACSFMSKFEGAMDVVISGLISV